MFSHCFAKFSVVRVKKHKEISLIDISLFPESLRPPIAGYAVARHPLDVFKVGCRPPGGYVGDSRLGTPKREGVSGGVQMRWAFLAAALVQRNTCLDNRLDLYYQQVRKTPSCVPTKNMYTQLSSLQLDTIEDKLLRGISDYLSKSGFSRCHLGLSGGLDSALVAYLAVRAVGKENTVCLILPSRFTSQRSLDDAEELANNLGCRHETLAIEPLYAGFLETLEPIFEGRPFDATEENLQARIRGTLLMAFSNKFRSMLLATGNKSELSMGYCTLYGDMCGGLAPLGDLYKTEVFDLCRRINEKSRLQTGKDVIPETILTKPPSAELRPNQTDQDTLPPYEVLDAVLREYFNHRSPEKIAEKLNVDGDLISRIAQTIAATEFKRRQAPPAVNVHTERTERQSSD